MDKKVTIDLSVRTVFVVVFSLVLIWLLYFLKDIFALVVISFVLATALEPAVNFLQKYRVPRWVSILGLYALVIGFLFTLFWVIVPPVTEQFQQLYGNRQTIITQINREISLAPTNIQSKIHEVVNSIPDRLSGYSSASILENALGVFSGVVGLITVFVIVFYLLLEPNSLGGFLIAYWPEKSRDRVVRIFNKVVEKVGLWARGQLILSGSIGLLSFIGLSVLHVPYAMTLALIAAVTELLPIVGPYIGAIPAVFLALTISPIKALWVMVLYVLTQQFEGHVLVPQVMKRAVGLSPVAIIIAVLIGAKLLGMIGIILAVPVAAGVVVVLDEIVKKKEKK